MRERYIKFFKENNDQLNKSFLCKFHGFDVYSVNGDYVKTNFNMDYVEGGNFKVYDFIPENEIWIDNNVDKEEYKYIMFHEYVEIQQMTNNDLDYNSAHSIANEFEKRYRERDIK